MWPARGKTRVTCDDRARGAIAVTAAPICSFDRGRKSTTSRPAEAGAVGLSADSATCLKTPVSASEKVKCSLWALSRHNCLSHRGATHGERATAGTEHARGPRSWRPTRQRRGPHARARAGREKGQRGLAASEARGAAPSPLPCALCRRRPRLARASDALSSLCPLSATRLSLCTETHTPGRAGGECGNALSRSHARRDRIATPPLAEGPLRGQQVSPRPPQLCQRRRALSPTGAEAGDCRGRPVLSPRLWLPQAGFGGQEPEAEDTRRCHFNRIDTTRGWRFPR